MYRILIYILSFIAINSCKTIYEKKAIKNERIAEAYLSTNQYSNAILYFEKALNHIENPYLRFKLGDCYWLIRDFNNARKHYSYNIENDTIKNKSDKYFNYANILMACGKYKSAQLWYLKYEKESGFKMYNRIQNCDSVQKWIQNQDSSIKIINIESINTNNSETCPAFYPNSLVFSSSREGMLITKESGSTGEPYFDLYISEFKNDSTLKKPSLLSLAINTPEHETASIFDSTGNIIYYTKGETDTTNTLKIKILQSIKKGQEWSKPFTFVLNDSIASFGQPFMNKQGTVFLFSSNLPGGYGGTDLFISFKKGNTWTIPENLGPNINTPGNEYYPYLLENGDLFFTSDGHLGMGGYDLFVSKFSSTGWTKVQNLRAPINSPADDLSLIISNNLKNVYFSSNRLGGKGKEDIYIIKGFKY